MPLALAPLSDQMLQNVQAAFLTAYKQGATTAAAEKDRYYAEQDAQAKQEADLAKEKYRQDAETSRKLSEIRANHAIKLSTDLAGTIKDQTGLITDSIAKLEGPDMDSASKQHASELRAKLGSTLAGAAGVYSDILSSNDPKDIPQSYTKLVSDLHDVLGSAGAGTERKINLPMPGGKTVQVTPSQAEDLKKGYGIEKDIAEIGKLNRENAGGGLKPEQQLKNQDDALKVQSTFLDQRRWQSMGAPKLAALQAFGQQLDQWTADRQAAHDKLQTLSGPDADTFRSQMSRLPDPELSDGWQGQIGGVPLAFKDKNDYLKQLNDFQSQSQRQEAGTGGYAGTASALSSRIIRGDFEAFPQYKGAQEIMSGLAGKYNVNTPEGLDSFINDAQRTYRSTKVDPDMKSKIKNTLSIFGVAPEQSPVMPDAQAPVALPHRF